MSMSSTRINRLAGLIDAKTYLEIGVAEGDTFHNVGIGHKTAVDPEFLFDVAQYSGRPDHFYFKLPSNQFFQAHGRGETGFPKDFRWDIIFIDGLHVYSQALTDFTNSVQYAGPDTIWIFDDTVPSDPWAAIPDMALCYYLRELAGIASGDWQGDVFKCVFAIHDFFPNFSYATVTGAGNPQTVVWRTEGSLPRPRLFASNEEIERLDYFGLLKRCAALNPVDEETLFSMVGRPMKTIERNGSRFLPLLVPRLHTF